MAPLIAFGVIVAALLVGLLGLYRRRGRAAAPPTALLSVPRRRIGEVRAGERARLSGRIAPGAKLLTAPISKRACVAWRVTIFERGSAQPLLAVGELEPFAIQDPTGKIVVPAEAELAIVLDHEGARPLPIKGRVEPCPGDVEGLLGKHRLKSFKDDLGRVVERDLEWAEGVIEPHEIVSVVGVVETKARDGLDHYRSEERYLTFRGGAERPTVTDERSIAMQPLAERRLRP